MSILTAERTTSFKDMLRLPKRRELAGTALRQTVESEPTTADISPELLARIEHIDRIKALPASEVDAEIKHLDVDLKDLIALGFVEANMADTQEIPAILTEAIDDTATLIVENWQDEDYNLNALTAITEAYVITHDETLIKKAEQVVKDNPGLVGLLPQIEDAIHFAAQHGDELDINFNVVAPIEGQPALEEKAGQSSGLKYDLHDRDSFITMSKRESYIGDDDIARYLSQPWSESDVDKHARIVADQILEAEQARTDANKYAL